MSTRASRTSEFILFFFQGVCIEHSLKYVAELTAVMSERPLAKIHQQKRLSSIALTLTRHQYACCSVLLELETPCTHSLCSPPSHFRIFETTVPSANAPSDCNASSHHYEVHQKNCKLRGVGKRRRCKVEGCCCCAWWTRKVKWSLL